VVANGDVPRLVFHTVQLPIFRQQPIRRCWVLTGTILPPNQYTSSTTTAYQGGIANALGARSPSIIAGYTAGSTGAIANKVIFTGTALVGYYSNTTAGGVT